MWGAWGLLRSCIGLEKKSKRGFNFSCLHCFSHPSFHTFHTATLNLSEHYLKGELYAGMPMSELVELDVKQTLQNKVCVISDWVPCVNKKKKKCSSLSGDFTASKLDLMTFLSCDWHKIESLVPPSLMCCKQNTVDDLLLCTTYVKGQLHTMSGPDSLDIFRSSYEKMAYVLLTM